jgi:ribonuclease D
MSIIRIPQLTDLEALPRYAGLPSERIVMPATREALAQAVSEITEFEQVGFDTESKPTFKVGEVSTGPHLIQIATPVAAYLFQVGIDGAVDAVKAVLESDLIVKVGFGLSSDRSRLRSRLGIELRHYIDLGTTLRYQGKKGQVGLRGAVAAVLNARVSKSRSVSTSNWANRTLTEAQRYYAANDAFAALEVYLALRDTSAQLLADRILPAR